MTVARTVKLSRRRLIATYLPELDGVFRVQWGWLLVAGWIIAFWAGLFHAVGVL